VRINLIDIDQFCEGLKEVTHPDIMYRNDYHPEGLFSKQIFGPESTAVCGCNIYWGRSHIGSQCPKCKVDITYANERRKRFAKICLPQKIVNPIMYNIIGKVGKTTIKKILNDLLFSSNVHGYYYNKKYVKITLEDMENEEFSIPEGVEVYTGINGAFRIINEMCDKYSEDNSDWKFIKDNMDKFFIHNLIVMPPEYRPASKSKDNKKIDKMNVGLRKILNFCMERKQCMLDGDNEELDSRLCKYLHNHIYELYDYIIESFVKKKGIIRKYILGRRVDFSGRAVIAPDPTLKIHQCSVPYVMVLELYKLDIANLLLEQRHFKRYDLALSKIEECIDTEDYIYYDMIKTWLCKNDKYVILNRQPTLHRLGILGFECLLNKNHVIKIHPFICEPYNADFDGDQMAIYKPLYKKTENEVVEKLSIVSNLLSPTTGNMSVGVSQDIILGLYELTKPDLNNKIKYNDINTYKGRMEFNKILPDDYPYINKSITKKLMKVILNDIIKTYDPKISCEVLDKIKELGFESTTYYGNTLSLKEMKCAGAKELRDSVYDDPTLSIPQKILKLKSDEIINHVKEEFPYTKFIESGSRGTWDQANQIILSRGYIANSQGRIINKPIKNNLIDGLTKEEFFISCYGSRKGLLDTAINTGVSGYLTRKLTYCASNCEVDLNCDDCGTDQVLIIDIPKVDENSKLDAMALARSFIGKTIVNKDGSTTEITYDNYDQFIGTTINVRSPIFCKNPVLCKTCYGNTHTILHSPYVGIIAAEGIGEVATQLVLRTFHTGGIATVNDDDDDENQDISNDLARAEKLFRCTEKHPYDKLLLELFKLFSNYSDTLFVHYEVIVSQMMRSGRHRWRVMPNRNELDIEMTSIESVPEKESYLLGMAFCKVKSYLIDGILDQNDKLTNDGILEKIMINDIL